MPPLTTPPGGKLRFDSVTNFHVFSALFEKHCYFSTYMFFPGSTTCAVQPCQNGGTCVPMGTSYSCFCGLNSVYTGKNCDTTTPMPVTGTKFLIE